MVPYLCSQHAVVLDPVLLAMILVRVNSSGEQSLFQNVQPAFAHVLCLHIDVVCYLKCHLLIAPALNVKFGAHCEDLSKELRIHVLAIGRLN